LASVDSFIEAILNNPHSKNIIKATQ